MQREVGKYFLTKTVLQIIFIQKIPAKYFHLFIFLLYHRFLFIFKFPNNDNP